MPDTTGPRSNRNPILAEFRAESRYYQRPTFVAHRWAGALTTEESPVRHWHKGATVSQQVFAARVLYRYAAVFGGVS